MVLTIIYLKNLERPWLLRRDDGVYEQHCHFKSYNKALKVKNLIEIGKYPCKKDEKYAVQRLLTEEEFKKLDKKDRYYNSGVYRMAKFR